MKKLFFFFFLFLVLSVSVFAEEKYSYENSEELKPLIEWRDYGDKAFSEALEEKKPIFLLLTAPTWCYWCQVYESEDYLFNPSVVDYLNENFIPVYVDADKRQDLTRQYLEGGWPSTTVFSPTKERIFGFSGPRPVPQMLKQLQEAVVEVRGSSYAATIGYDYSVVGLKIPTQQELNGLVSGYALHTLQMYDSTYGGFGSGQKFPQGRVLDYSLDLYEQNGDTQWLDLVKNTLENQYTSVSELQTNYNLYDPLEGGFHRYGTERDWTPPHYEKMLYDNARLLKAYGHLLFLVPENEIVREVVEGTHSYIKENWYDPAGGFYGNTDVAGEDAYYGQNPRPIPKARVEKTKFSDWNADAIVTYLYLWEQTGNEEYKDMALSSLQFFSIEMVTKEGAYHYSNDDGKGVRGTLLDNAYLLLAFIEGYDTFNDKELLETAKTLADYSLETLYDWHNGGFFERHSPDKELYALGDHILLTKPSPENGVMVYALVKLYSHTNDQQYLHAALTTFGRMQDSVGGLDRGYYYIKAAEFIDEKNLLEKYDASSVDLPTSFWADKLVKKSELTSFDAAPQAPLLLLVLVSLLVGFISFASPCSLPILPAYLAYTFNASKHNLKGMTFSFFLGLSVVFSLLGMSASWIGGFLKEQTAFFSEAAGFGLLLFGIYILLGKGFAGMKLKLKKPTSYAGSFLFGVVFGLSWTPCVGPLLVAILLLAGATSSMLTGGFLLFAYAVGLALPLLVLSLYLDKVDKNGKLWTLLKGKELKILGKSIHSNNLISGILFILLGFLIFSGQLYVFNQYLGSTGFQQIIFTIEEKVLGLLG